MATQKSDKVRARPLSLRSGKGREILQRTVQRSGTRRNGNCLRLRPSGVRPVESSRIQWISCPVLNFAQHGNETQNMRLATLSSHPALVPWFVQPRLGVSLPLEDSLGLVALTSASMVTSTWAPSFSAT